MIHEHDMECTSFCSAALPPEREADYQYAVDEPLDPDDPDSPDYYTSTERWGFVV
jgi:hypothetical protein